MMLGSYGALPPQEALAKAKSAITNAIQLNPDLGEVQLSSAWVDWNLEHELSDHHAKFEKAIELAPGYANAYHWYGWYLRALREYDRAEKLFKEALELDPLSVVFTTSLGQFYLCQGNMEQAIQKFEQALELDPIYPRAHNRLGQALVVSGKQELGIHHINLSIKYSDRNPQYVATLALASGFSGQINRAEQIIKDLIQMSEIRYVSEINFAIAYFGQGNEEKGFDYLNETLKTNKLEVGNVLLEILLLYFHDHPGFENILKQI
jgi:tetratricopeptide (TPR) repeat protein